MSHGSRQQQLHSPAERRPVIAGSGSRAKRRANAHRTGWPDSQDASSVARTWNARLGSCRTAGPSWGRPGRRSFLAALLGHAQVLAGACQPHPPRRHESCGELAGRAARARMAGPVTRPTRECVGRPGLFHGALVPGGQSEGRARVNRVEGVAIARNGGVQMNDRSLHLAESLCSGLPLARDEFVDLLVRRGIAPERAGALYGVLTTGDAQAVLDGLALVEMRELRSTRQPRAELDKMRGDQTTGRHDESPPQRP
jgi:hypothetical protein